MNPRQAFALANPLNSASGDLTPYRSTIAQRDGSLLLVVLAVDR